jgi:polysaccharide pyruvyl transferase WcaK-like protein
MGSTIGLINTYSTLNIGDSAIYSALASMASDAQVFAHVQDPEPEYTPGLQVLDQLPSCDAYISVGGDIFNNAREGLITKAFLKNLYQLTRSPKQTMVFGQSIPRSCHGLSFQALTGCFRRLAAVCVRDVESYQRLTKAGVSALLSYDSAFVLEVTEQAKQEAQNIFQALDVAPDLATLISLRTFDAMYAHDNQRFAQQLVGLCRNLLAQGEQPVLLIQSRAYGSDNDLEMAAAIVAQVPQVKIFNPFLATTALSRWQLVMGALAIARQIVAIRYHTAVLALASGRTPFNLYYSNKGRDLTERLNIPGCNLAQFDPEIHLDQILQTAQQNFDHKAIRDQVQQNFNTCFAMARKKSSAKVLIS